MLPGMEIKTHEYDGQKVAEVLADGIVIRTAGDALDLMAHPPVQSPKKIILHADNINPDFFDLRTGLAGEILQKSVTYHVQLAIVGDFSGYQSESLQALIRESNRGGQTFFVGSTEEALRALTG